MAVDPLKYVGKLDNTGGQLATFDWANTKAAAVAVTTQWVNNVIATIVPDLATPTYVDSQVALRATQAAVNTDQARYVNATQKGAASGVATLDGSSYVTASQVPSGISTENVVQCYNAADHGVINLASGSTHTVTTSAIDEYTGAQINIPNPGYTYIPMPFVYIMGQAGGTPSGRQYGTNRYGLITVVPSPGTGKVYGVGICTGSPYLNWYHALPTANVLQGVLFGQLQLPVNPPTTPLTTRPITGPLTLNMNLSCYSGSSYTFSGTGLQFFVLTMPAI